MTHDFNGRMNSVLKKRLILLLSFLLVVTPLSSLGPVSRAEAAAMDPMKTVVSNYEGDSLYIVDLTTGKRDLLSGGGYPGRGGGSAMMSEPMAVAMEPGGTILAGQYRPASVIYRVDPDTGDRTVVSGGIVGTRPSLASITSLVPMSNGDIIACTGFSILRIQAGTGDRTTIASGSVGSEAPFATVWGCIGESDGSIIYATMSKGVYKLDPTTMERTEVSTKTKGTGPFPYGFSGIAKAADGSYIVLTPNESVYAFRIDPATGDRTPISGVGLGEGPDIGRRNALTIGGNGEIFVADYENNRLIAIDPVTGNRRDASSTDVGFGPGFNSPQGMLANAVSVVTTHEKYVVMYNGNGHTGGAVPVDLADYETGAMAYVRDNIFELEKTGYTFDGWSTEADGSGTNYAPWDQLVMGNANVTLYAKWKPDASYKVLYDGNGHTAGSAPIDPDSYKQGDDITVQGNTGGLAKTGYTFTGWNKKRTEAA